MSFDQKIPAPIRAAYAHVKAHPITYAGVFWVSSSLALTSAMGLGGTPQETIGGAVIFGGEATALTLGNKWRYAYNVATTAFITGTWIQKEPDLLIHPWKLAPLLVTLTVANAPAMLEFCTKDKAREKLEAFRNAGHSLVARTKSSLAKKALWCFANPRSTALNTNGTYLLASLGAVICKHQPYTLRYLVPFYGLMFVGNRIATLSEKRTTKMRTKIRPSTCDVS